MKSFYSIIYLSPNHAVSDQVSVGALLFDGEKFEIHFSDEKIRIVQKLLGSSSQFSLKALTKDLERNILKMNLKDSKELDFQQNSPWGSPSYFDYLSNYSNGLLQFSKAKPFIQSGTGSEFEKLVTFLFNESIDEEKKISQKDERSVVISKLIQTKLINRVKHKVHTNLRFTPELMPTVHFTFEIDTIGLNGAFVGAKSLSFDSGVETIDKHLSHYYTLMSILANQKGKRLEDNNFYLISDEPALNAKRQHQIWESVKNNPLIKVIVPEESEMVAEMIEQKNASVFLPASV